MNDTELAAFLNAREGKLTASRMAAAMSFRKDGKPSMERSNLQREILAERLAGGAMPHFVSPEMRWGLEQEASAKAAYEARTGELVGRCQTIDHPSIDMCAATPDGLIDPDGLIETKCPKTTTHISWMLAGAVPHEHRPQMLLQLACTGRKWVDFVSFDPRLPPQRQLFIKRFAPSRAEIEEVEEAARLFLAEVDAMFEQLAVTS